MRIAWFLRKRLPVEQIGNPLLKNVADTLGYVRPAAALARALFETNEDFFKFADAYQPPFSFHEQYRTRIAVLREDGELNKSDYFFLQLENKVRAQVLDGMVGIEVRERKGVQLSFH